MYKFLPFLIVFFIGCVNNQPQKKDSCNINSFYKYQQNSKKITGIGIAPPNFYGENAQRKSAIAKALDEIARQKGIKINTTLYMQRVKNLSSTNSSTQIYSIQTANQSIKAKIVKECYKDGYLYILMESY